jgi:hypothetical protein
MKVLSALPHMHDEISMIQFSIISSFISHKNLNFESDLESLKSPIDAYNPDIMGRLWYWNGLETAQT